ncbi:MAG: TRAP transporter small permease [Pseudomonadota bacterium]
MHNVTDNRPPHDTFAEGIEEVADDISDVKGFDIPVLLLFLILFIIVALQFFTRYVLNDSLGWTEEIARYFLILLGFVGGITCVRKGKHIFLEFAYNYMPTKAIKPTVVVVETVVTGFWGYAGWLAIELAEKTNANMVSVTIPKAYLYYIVAMSCCLMAVFALINLINKYRTPGQDIIRAKRHQAVMD